MCERAPEIVDEVGLPRLANVVKDGARLGREFIVGKQLHGRHGNLAGLLSRDRRYSMARSGRSAGGNHLCGNDQRNPGRDGLSAKPRIITIATIE
jgi:hypothetical protein